MNIEVNKSRAVGTVDCPPSKSLTHRYIIAAALSKGKSVISNVQFSEDIKASIDCAKELGSNISIDGSTVYVEGAQEKEYKSLEFHCKESGSTIRFFMGIAMGLGTPSCFYGSKTLLSRPFGIYESLAQRDDMEFERFEDHIYVNGKLKGGIMEIPGDISSQFITGLLFSLPLLDCDSEIKLIPPVESRSYIELTIQALNEYGVTVSWKDKNTLTVKGGQKYKCADVCVEGDYSNAAFLEAFNTIGGEVLVNGLNPDSLQGDKVYTEHLKTFEKDKPEIDLSDCPDLGPVLMAMAAAHNGAVFTGTRRLKIKESNRGEVMCRELSKFGVKSVMEENRIEIEKCELCKPSEALLGHNDHRIVMSLTLLLTLTGGTLLGAEAVRKSYPEFFDVCESLGIEVRRYELD